MISNPNHRQSRHRLGAAVTGVAGVVLLTVLVIGFVHSFDRPYEGLRRAVGIRDMPAGDPLECAMVLADRLDRPGERGKALVRIAEAHVTVGSIDRGLTLAESLPDSTARVTVALDAVDTYTRRGQKQAALDLLLQTWCELRDHEDCGAPVPLLARLAGGFAKLQRPDLAWEVSKSIPDRAGRLKVRIDLCRTGDPERIVELWSDIRTVGERHPQRSELLADFACAVVLSRCDPAEQAVEQVEEPKQRVDALIRLADVATESNRHEAAGRVLRTAIGQVGSFKRPGDRADCLARIVVGLLKIEDVSGARETIDMLTAGALPSVEHGVEAVTEAAVCCAEAGLVNEALAVVDFLPSSIHKSYALNGIAIACPDFDGPHAPDRFLAAVVDHVDRVAGMPHRVRLLLSLAEDAAGKGARDQAERLLAFGLKRSRHVDQRVGW